MPDIEKPRKKELPEWMRKAIRVNPIAAEDALRRENERQGVVRMAAFADALARRQQLVHDEQPPPPRGIAADIGAGGGIGVNVEGVVGGGGGHGLGFVPFVQELAPQEVKIEELEDDEDEDEEMPEVRANEKDFVGKRLFNKKLVYIVGFDGGVTKMFEGVGAKVVNITAPTKTFEALEKPMCVIFTGGSDVSPILYGEANTRSSSDIQRDVNEMIWFKAYRHIPKIGICRGGQFLNVMCGGSMNQHIEGHAINGVHKLKFHHWHCATNTVTSTHHQGMRQGRNGSVIASHEGVNEVIYYGDDKSLCFQPHPEYDSVSCRNIFFSLISHTGWF